MNASPDPGAGLGPVLRTFPYDPEQRKVTLFVGLGFFALAALFPVLYAIDPIATGTVPLFFSPLLVLGGLGCLAHWLYTGRIAMVQHAGGIVYGGTIVPWARVRGVRYKLVVVSGGYASYNRGFVEVRLDDGRVFSPSMQLEAMDEAIGAIVGGAMPVLVNGILGALRAGQVVRSGPFELRPDGIGCKGKVVRWPRAALSSAGYPPHLTLMDVDPEEGDHVTVHEAKAEDVESGDAIEQVADQLRAEAIRRGER